MEIEEIIKYKNAYLKSPDKGWPEQIFKKRSIERAVIDMFLTEYEEAVLKEQKVDVRHILFNLHEKMDSLYEENSEKELSTTYAIARDFLKELYLEFC